MGAGRSKAEVARMNKGLKPQGKRWCPKCETVVMLTDVCRSGCCLECSRKQAKAWRASNPERKSAQNLRYRTEGPQDRRQLDSPVVSRPVIRSAMAEMFEDLTDLIEYSTPPDHSEDEEINTLYRFFDSSGVLLYVGITYNPPARFRSHAGSKEWWGQVSTINLEQYISRKAVLHAEREAIRSELPLFNLMHSSLA